MKAGSYLVVFLTITTFVFVVAALITICAVSTAYAQDHENIEQVSKIFNRWYSIDDVAIKGDYAYLVAPSAGLQVIDISEPANPIIEIIIVAISKNLLTNQKY